MAYNPFNIFRRNQKAIFAVITVFIMFTFVLSSGLGGGADFFDWLPQWLGKKTGKKGDDVCKIDGTKVYDGDLSQLRYNRVMANRFMDLAAKQTMYYLGQYEDEQLRQVTSEEMRRLLVQGPQAEQRLRDPQFQLLRSFNPEMALQTERIAQAYAAIPASPTAPPAAKQVVLARLQAMTLQYQLMLGRNEQYFINAPNRTQRDLVNFMLWQKKADQLGIKFTTDDINRLIQNEFFGPQFHRSDVEIRKQLQQGLQGFTMEKCLAAIGEEFRVRTAQVAVLGPGMHGRTDKTFGGSPVFSPAYEVFDFYRDQCSPTLYEVVAVPGANFLDKVVGEPTEAELKKLYDDYQNMEYDPALERPGFRIPRTLKLGWASATGTEPYYLKKAEETLKNEELQSALWSLAAVAPVVVPVEVATATRPFVANPLADLYASRIEAEHRRKIGDWDSPYSDRRLLDTSVVRTPNMAAVLGGLAGGQLTLGGPLPGLALLDTAACAMERRDRIKASTPALMLMLGTMPHVSAGKVFGIPVGKPIPAPAFGPAMFPNLIGGVVAYQMMLPKPLPIEAVRDELLKELRTGTAKRLAYFGGTKVRPDRTYPNNVERIPGDMPAYTEVVSKLSNAGGFLSSLVLPKFMHDFAAERGWQRGDSVAAHDEWTLEDDPGLAPLKAALPKSVHGNEPVRFGKRFFWADTRPGEAKAAATGTYQPEYYPNAPSTFESPEAKPEPKFLVWRTEETPGAPPKSFAQARESVKAAWKRIKARELAKARADSLANAIQSSGGDFAGVISQNVKDLAEGLKGEFTDPKAKERVKVFTVPGVAPLAQTAPDRNNPFAMTGGMQRFMVTPTSDIPYPSADMTKQLLDERTKPAKTAFVMVDEPKDTYYVGTVVYRSPKTQDDFKFDVYRDIGFGQTRATVMSEYMRDSQRKTYESVMGLLKKEFKYEETDEQKARFEENEKRGGDQ